jgi:DNA-binding NtrC family response regulator
MTMDSEESKAKILIAEDERGPREVLEMVLKPFFTLYTAKTGQIVLEILEKEEIDIVTVDLHMPGFAGLDLLKAIREIRPKAEMIIITGESGSRVQMVMDMFNIVGYILKPFDIEELLTVVNGTLQRKRRVDALESEALTESNTARSLPKDGG